MAYTTKSGSYLIAVMDQPQTPGLSPPVNFFTTLSSLSKEYLQNAAENAAKADLSFLAGHYPISSFSDKTNYFLESYLIDSPFAAYLCGHYHLPKALFRREDVLELEVGDMKSSGQYRVMAVDNGVFSFADQNSDEFPVVVMTNPKPANIMTRKEKLEYMTGSSHVRVLAFSDMDISRVYMQVDGGVEREMSQVQPGHPLFVVGWNAVDYGIGLHTLTVRVTDQAGREKRVVEQFSLDGTAPSPATFVTFFLILDQPELVRFLYIFCVVVVLILRLLLPKMWVGVSMCLKGSRSSHELLNKVEGVEEGRDAEDSESTRRKKGREIIFVETKGVTAQSRGPVVRVNTEESVVVDSDEDSEIEGREEEEEVEEGDAVVYSEGRRKRRSVEGEDVTEYGDIELGNVGSSRGEGKAGRTSSAVLEGDGESNGREKGRQRAVSKDDEMGGQVTGETSKVRSGGVTGRGGKASEEIDANDSDHDRIGTVVEGSARGVVDGHSDEVEDEENGDVNHVRAPAEKRRGRCAEKTGRFMLAISKEIRYTVRRYSNMPAKYWIPLTIICLLMCIMPIVAGPIMGGGHVGLLLPFGKAVLLRSPVEVLVSSSPSSPSLPSQPFQSKGNTSMVTAPLVVIEEPRAAVMSSYLLILVHLPAMALISVTLPPRRSQRGWAKVEKGGKRAVLAGVGNFDKALRKKTVMLLLTFVVGSAAWLGVIATGFSLATLLFSPATYYVLTDWVLFVHVMVAQRRSSYHQLGAAR
uniref:TMEM62 Ig-like domain-containing protein n=1 Tax=Palpitomonas bilix TaxID=652834 RepID=A0A7S3G0A9_9EUKA